MLQRLECEAAIDRQTAVVACRCWHFYFSLVHIAHESASQIVTVGLFEVGKVHAAILHKTATLKADLL